MPTVEKISLALPHEMVAIVRQAVDTGEYASSSEVPGQRMRVELSRFIEGDPRNHCRQYRTGESQSSTEFCPGVREHIRAVGRNPSLYQLPPELDVNARMDRRALRDSVLHSVQDRQE